MQLSIEETKEIIAMDCKEKLTFCNNKTTKNKDH